MPEALPLPMRVLVKGASNVNWISPMGGPRTDFTFPRAMEAALLGQGRPVDVRVVATRGQKASSALFHWERDTLAWSPDVVVLYYGVYETIHLLLPWWLERHANSWRARPGRLRAIYRDQLLRPIWRVLVKAQALADRRLPATFRRRDRRVAMDIERLLEHLREVGNPLVVLFEIVPPQPRPKELFPGMPERVERMNAAIADVASRFGPDVRIFPTSEIVRDFAAGDLGAAQPDGYHFTPRLHRAVGERLGAMIAEWADGQEHLALEPRPRQDEARRTTSA